jgi:hypothetical protein
MPSSYTFCSCVAANFPESRDAHADIVGYVEPGDGREFDAPFGATPPEDADERAWWFPAPTADWFPSDGELPKRLADPEPEQAADGAESKPQTPAGPALLPGPAFTPHVAPAADVTPHEPDEHEI